MRKKKPREPRNFYPNAIYFLENTAGQVAIVHGSRLIDAKQVARVLQVDESTVMRLSATGKLPTPVNIAGTLRWIKEDIRRRVTVVVQLPMRADFVPQGPEDLAVPRSLAAALANELDGIAEVDGSDIGGGSINLFAYAKDPARAISIVLKWLKGARLEGNAVIATRPTDESDRFRDRLDSRGFTVVWPRNSKRRFSLCPSDPQLRVMNARVVELGQQSNRPGQERDED